MLQEKMPRKIMIDVDTGVDDAQAIMLALSYPEIEVVGITCVAGNVDVDKVCVNTLKVLKICGRLDIPVYRGAASALTSEGFTARHYHGNDGLGDTDLEIDVDLNLIKPVHATSALIDATLKQPGEITLVALAPLTNIALALKIDPDFGRRLKDVIIMGGNIEGKGNTTFISAEFNFGCDPEAAQLVLNSLHAPITIFPWEINLSELAGQPWEWYDSWILADTVKGRFLKAISRKPVQIQRNRGNPIFRSCDMSAMATVLEPSIVTESVSIYATVETKGQFTRGMMVIDWRGIFEKQSNISVVKKIDTKRARELFEQIVLHD